MEKESAMAGASVGQVDVVLDGKHATLRGNLDAAKLVSAIANGSGYIGALVRHKSKTRAGCAARV